MKSGRKRFCESVLLLAQDWAIAERKKAEGQQAFKKSARCIEEENIGYLLPNDPSYC